LPCVLPRPNTIGNCTIDVRAFVHYGSTIGDHAMITTDAVVMKGEHAAPGTLWGRNPARPLARNPALADHLLTLATGRTMSSLELANRAAVRGTYLDPRPGNAPLPRPANTTAAVEGRADARQPDTADEGRGQATTARRVGAVAVLGGRPQEGDTWMLHKIAGGAVITGAIVVLTIFVGVIMTPASTVALTARDSSPVADTADGPADVIPPVVPATSASVAPGAGIGWGPGS